MKRNHFQYKDPVTGEVGISDQEYKPESFGYVGGQVFHRDSKKFQGTASDIQGTEDDPLFQTMREGMETYRFDVEKGYYRISLLFAKPKFNASDELIYNLSASGERAAETVCGFEIMINDKLI